MRAEFLRLLVFYASQTGARTLSAPGSLVPGQPGITPPEQTAKPHGAAALRYSFRYVY